MSSGDSLLHFPAASFSMPNWYWVAFTSGSAEPSVGEVMYGDTSTASATLEYLSPLTSGTWGGGDAAGWMFLSNDAGNAWTSGENVTFGSDTAANELTITTTPTACYATFDTINNVLVADFDDTTNELIIVEGTLPSTYSGGGLTVTAQIATAAATGDVSIAGMFRSFTDDTDNLLSTTFNAWGTRQDNTAVDAPTTIGEITYDDLTFTSGAQMDSLAAGEKFQFAFFRDAQDGTNDDHTGDMNLIALTIKET